MVSESHQHPRVLNVREGHRPSVFKMQGALACRIKSLGKQNKKPNNNNV